MHVSPRLVRWIAGEFDEAGARRVISDLGDLPPSVVGGQDLERIQAALVIRSAGDLSRVRAMRRLAEQDWRDLLVAAGLGDVDWPSVLDDVLGVDGGTAPSVGRRRRWTGRGRRVSGHHSVPLAALVVLLSCALVGFGATAFGVSQVRARTATAAGEVLDSGDTVRNRFGQQLCKDATVTFPLDQRRYSFTGLVRSRCPQDGGPATVTVYYDPDEPANAETSNDSAALTGFMVLAAAGVVVCTFLLAGRATRSRRRRGT